MVVSIRRESGCWLPAQLRVLGAARYAVQVSLTDHLEPRRRAPVAHADLPPLLNEVERSVQSPPGPPRREGAMSPVVYYPETASARRFQKLS